MNSHVDICVVGAGPYGLSVASHLGRSGKSMRMFGKAFSAWRFEMPPDMILKSAGFASSLSDPESELTIDKFFASRGIPYEEDRFPIKVQDFIAYGMHFQERFAPQLEDKKVEKISRAGDGFVITLADGEQVTARKVVMATGTSGFAHMPKVLSGLPSELVTHSSGQSGFDHFRGRELVVIGGGASAVNAASSAHYAGASVNLFAPRHVEFDTLPSEIPSKWLEAVIRPRTGLGPGWVCAVMTWAPWVFSYLPSDLRVKIVQRKLGPAAGCYMRDKVEGHVPMHLHTRLESATEHGGRLRLVFRNSSAKRIEVEADHLIAGTGFRVDLRRAAILDSHILDNLRTLNGSPVLSRKFESSVPGLYFTGLAAAVTFGPLLRFVDGTRFAAKTISGDILASLQRASRLTGAGSALANRRNARSVGEPGL